MPNPNREAIIDLGGKIASLRAELQRVRQELKGAESELDRLLANHAVLDLRAGVDDAMTMSDANAVGVGVVSLNQRIVALLDSQPGRRFTSDDVFASLPDANQTSVRSALSRLADQDKIRKTDRGVYVSTNEAADFTDALKKAGLV